MLELNNIDINNNNNNNENNNNDNNDNNDNNINNINNKNNKRAEWKIHLTMQTSCISTRSFEEIRTIYTKSKPVEILRVVTQKISLIDFLIHFYKIFKMQQKHQKKEGVNLFLIASNYYIIIFIK